jgi:hypothetical protein
MSLQIHFKTKYDLFLESKNYELSFSWIDGFLFYELFTQLSILKPSDQQKNIAWDNAKKTWKDWYMPTENNPRPNKLRFINESKHLLLKDFVFCMAEDLELSNEVMEKLGL